MSSTEVDTEIAAWLRGRIPDGWFLAPPEITVDREELLIIGTVADVELEDGASAPTPAARAAARSARTSRFREETRAPRMRIAEEAEHRFAKKVSWGTRIGDTTALYTTVSVPVMTRLRQPERIVLDTLVDAGVARSRSDALAWCVKLVGANESEWIQGLRDALIHVEKVRSEGPTP
ncbi:MAG TPA: hypothetical protein VM143_13175 [Acidimicrobiales bacterium]|nr:hypothetical protein [Acidimicrobiales bacterium]